MKTLENYTILQTQKDGFGYGRIAGEYVADLEKYTVTAQVCREDDNLVILPWFCCQTEKNRWFADIKLPRGGLYRVEVRIAEGAFSPFTERYEFAGLIALINHIGVGEVFILAGQSNMSGYGRDFAYDPPVLGVHAYKNDGKWDMAAHPLNSVPQPVFSNNDAASGTSPGLAFGRMMAKRLNCPIGLITAAQGGSLLSEWTPFEGDGRLFNEMKKKVNDVGAVAGMVWLQGCAEAMDDNADGYLRRFTDTVKAWRECFGDFPVVTCQINRHAYLESGSNESWGKVREAQRMAARTIPGVYIVPTLDLYTTDGIHNSSGANVIIGERMANEMLRGAYGFSGTGVLSVNRVKQADDTAIDVYFDTPVPGIRTMDDVAEGLNVQDEKGLMNCTGVYRTQDGVRVLCERKITGKAVFHAYWKKVPPAFVIRDVSGLPMLACYGVEVIGG